MLSGRRLKDLRNSLHISQSEVAKRLCITRNYISMLENEKQAFSENFYNKWINALYGSDYSKEKIQRRITNE